MGTTEIAMPSSSACPAECPNKRGVAEYATLT